MATNEPTSWTDRNLIRFATEMRQIPKRAIRCEIYGTISAVVDERHARNIFRKVAPAATREAVQDALTVLGNRLEYERA